MVPPATTRATVLIKMASAQGLSDTYPTRSLPTVLTIPMVEMIQALCNNHVLNR